MVEPTTPWSSPPGRAPLVLALVRMLLLLAVVFAGVQCVLELVAWVNRVATVSGKTDAEVRATIIGDIAPFLEHAASEIPERDRVLLVTNESPWRARYLLLPRAVYVYHGPLPGLQDLEGKFLKEEEAFLHSLGISWIVFYTRTTTGPYRIIDSAVVPVAPLAASGAPPASAAPGRPDIPGEAFRLPSPNGSDGFAVLQRLGRAPLPLGEGKGEGADGGAAEEREAVRSPFGRHPMRETLVALMVTVLAGGAVLGVIEPRRGLFSYESLSLAYGLGTGCITVALFLLSWLGFPLHWCWPVILMAGLAGFGALLTSRLRRRGAERDMARRVSPEADSRPRGLPPAGGEPKSRSRWLSPLLVTCLLLLFVSQGYYTSIMPINAMDAMGFWGYSAKAIFFDDTVKTLAITDPLREHPHPRYPLLVPLAQVWVHLLGSARASLGLLSPAAAGDLAVASAAADSLGSTTSPRGYEDKAVKLLFVGFYVALAGVVYGAGKRAFSGGARRSRQATSAGLVAALLVATLPPLRADGYGAAFALADVPLACYIASALVCWVRWAEGGDLRALLLASFFGAFAAWTKNEGLAFFAILTVLTAARAGVQWRRATVPTSAVGGTGASPRPHRAGGRPEHPCASDARALAPRVPVPPASKRSIHVNFRELGRSAVALAAGWLLLVPWLLFRHSLPIADENYPAHLRPEVLLVNLGRLPVVLLTWLREFADASQWGVLWLLASVAAVWAVRGRSAPAGLAGREAPRPDEAGRATSEGRSRKATALWLLTFGFCQLLVYTVVYVVAPWDVAELLKLTSTRLLLHVLPGAVLLSLTMVAALWTDDQRTLGPVRSVRLTPALDSRARRSAGTRG